MKAEHRTTVFTVILIGQPLQVVAILVSRCITKSMAPVACALEHTFGTAGLWPPTAAAAQDRDLSRYGSTFLSCLDKTCDSIVRTVCAIG